MRKILTTFTDAEETENPPLSSDYRFAIRALLKANRSDLAFDLFRLRNLAHERRGTLPVDFGISVAVLKARLREEKKRKRKAEEGTEIVEYIIKEAELKVEEGGKAVVGAMIKLLIVVLTEGWVQYAKKVINMLERVHVEPGDGLDVADYNNAIRLLGKIKALDSVFVILELMRRSGVDRDNVTFEFLANAAVKQVEFITGAVSLDTLPDPIAPEVAFVGRSNVGKSSLVNMVCGRKALAYVSGRPGKTQQFNYFMINGNDHERRFYIVDLPGVGYAKVPKHLQAQWLDFMASYFRYRTSLRLVFHLVDGRHGTMEDDEQLMRQMAISGRQVEDYIVVLTKMDKMDKQKAKNRVLNKTRDALKRNGCSSNTTIVLTSANTKLGRDEMWRHLQRALSGRQMKQREVSRNK